MPTILNAGTTQLSNADVLQWIQAKRAQHKQEDEEDATKGRSAAKRPPRFMNSLRKHERELTDKKYPYITNSGAYGDDNRHKSVATFIDICDAEILAPREALLAQNAPASKIKAVLTKEFEKKTLTNNELLMIQNLAPENVSMLELMIEGWDQRFSAEEMEKLVEIIHRVFRCGTALPESTT